MPTNATIITESSSLPRPAQDRPAPSYTCDTERHLFGPFDSHENQKKLSDWLDHNPKLAIYCRCNPLSEQPARLVIRDIRRHPSDSQRYIVLARRPGQADQHTPACRHSEQRVATRVTAGDGDIASRTFSGISSTWPSPKQLPPDWVQAQPKVDCPILVDLDFSLGETEGWTSTGPPLGRSGRHWTDDRRRHHPSGEGLPRKSAAALLLRLIERAGLNQYLGQPIAHRDIFVQLRKAAALVMVRPRGALSTQRLSDILVMPDLSRQDIRDRLDLAYKSRSGLLFVAPVQKRPTSVHPQDASEFHLDWSADLGVPVKSKTVWVVEHLKAQVLIST